MNKKKSPNDKDPVPESLQKEKKVVLMKQEGKMILGNKGTENLSECGLAQNKRSDQSYGL